MSKDIFGKTQLAEFNAPELGVPLVIGDDDIDTEGLYITSISAAHNPTVQILSAVDSSVWINTFGQKPSPAQLGGIIVPTDCSETGGDPKASVKRSLMKVYKKYKINKAEEPLQITYNGIVMTGYFLDLKFSNSNGGIPKAMEFTITYLCIVESALGSKEADNAAFSS